MSTQLLVNVITVTVPAFDSVTVAHGLKSNGVSVAPKLVLPGSASLLTVSGVTDTSITFNNPTENPITGTFRVERGVSIEVEAEDLSLVVVPAAAPATGGVASVSVAAPITNTGTASDPIIGADVGSSAGTVCAGNDPRLSDERVPTNGSVTSAKIAAGAVTPSKIQHPRSTLDVVGWSNVLPLVASKILVGQTPAMAGEAGLICFGTQPVAGARLTFKAANAGGSTVTVVLQAILSGASTFGSEWSFDIPAGATVSLPTIMFQYLTGAASANNRVAIYAYANTAGAVTLTVDQCTISMWQ